MNPTWSQAPLSLPFDDTQDPVPESRMLIDDFIPHWDAHAEYGVDVLAPADRAYVAARTLDMTASKIIRLLFRLRGMPSASLTFEGMLQFGFVLLAEEPPREIVFGLIGRFWSRRPRIERIQAAAFASFDRPGFAKVASNIACTPRRDGRVRVTTETRILGLDDDSRRAFMRYWRLIGPFSGLVRKEWLRLIKTQAEVGSSSGHITWT